MAQEQGKEVAPPAASGSGAVAKRPYQSVVEQIQGRAQLDSSQTDSFEFAANAIDAMAEASKTKGTPEEILAAMVKANKESGLLAAEDMFNVPITVVDVTFSKAAEKFAKGGVGAWVVIDAKLDNGDEVQIKSGAANVVTFLYLAQSNGLLPVRIKITGKDTANGTLQQVDLP